MNSLGTFLSIELSKFNRLLKKQKATLSEVQRAIKGLVVMSSELDAMYSSFLINQVPIPRHPVAPHPIPRHPVPR